MDEDRELSRFDVAIWQTWPPSECELPVIGLVSAVDAAEAVVAVMQTFGLTRAAHVAARDQAQRLMHRAYGVRIPEQEPGLVRKKAGCLAMASH